MSRIAPAEQHIKDAHPDAFDNLHDLRGAILAAAAKITILELEEALASLLRRMRLCVSCEGGAFEHLL